MNLFDFLGSIIFKTVKKEDLQSELTYLDDYYNKHDIPVVNNLTSALTSITTNNSKNVTLLVNFFNRSHIPSVNKSIIAVSKTISKDLKSISPIIDSLRNAVDKEFEDVTFTRSMTIRQAAILRSIEHLEYISSFTLALVDYIIDEEINNKVKNTKTPKYKTDYIFGGITDYISLLNVYNNLPSSFDQWIKRIPDIVITKDGGNKGILPKNPLTKDVATTKNFIGSPFLSIGMYMAELQVEYYNYVASRKQTIDQKLLQLKLVAEKGETNPAIKKQIDYYEEKSRKLKEKLEAQEESVKDDAD